MLTWNETLLSQYVDSPTLTGLIEAINDAIDPSADLQALYSNLVNISTAVGQGLDNWGQIVGVSRNLTITATQTYFGFSESITSSYTPQSFGQAPMYPGSMATQTLALSDDAYRQLILVKAATNICNLTAQSLNNLLCGALGLVKTSQSTGSLLGVGTLGSFQLYNPAQRAYVQDTGDMSQRFMLEFVPTAYQIAVLTQAEVLPRSAGVRTTLVIAPTGTFGFSEASFNTPFGYGTLFPNSGLQNAS